MNLVNKEYHKRARILLENWQDQPDSRAGFMEPSSASLAAAIDLFLLTADTSISEINKLCKDALVQNVAGICVNPVHVERCVQLLDGKMPVTCVVGFPLGASHPKTKVFEAELAVSQGARALELVLNRGLLKTSNFQEVFEEIRAVRHACPESNLTVILEAGQLDPLEIIIACMLCREAGVDDVKSATGYSDAGTSTEAVSLMRFVLGEDLGVIAGEMSPDRGKVLAFLKAGATRLSLNFSAAGGTLSGFIDDSDLVVNE
ncbi:MAG: deoxyribose-phosphate aldolase [Candidatus Marinimicrobia bacterium]|nr:deoxyribose-phosphate aldolase [Candidatus Neomarinimicrobiota bacterium]